MQRDFCAFDEEFSWSNVPSRPTMDIDNVELSSRISSTVTSSSDELARRSKHSDACSRKERLTLAEKLRIIGLYSTGTSQVNRRDNPLGRYPCLITARVRLFVRVCHFTSMKTFWLSVFKSDCLRSNKLTEICDIVFRRSLRQDSTKVARRSASCCARRVKARSRPWSSLACD